MRSASEIGELHFGDKAGSTDYYFRLFNDRNYLVCDREQVGNGWLSGDGVDWAKCYAKCDLEIVHRLYPKGDGEVTDLVFFAIPDVGKNRASGGQCIRVDTGINTLKADAGKKPVFATVAELVQNPNGTPLASLVRLERPKERKDIWWQVIAAAFAYHVRVEHRGGVGDREVSKFRFPFSNEERCGISKVVQRGSEVLDSLNYPQIEDSGDVFCQPTFVRFGQATRVRLAKKDIRLAIPEFATAYFECVEQFFCASNSDFRAQKWITHGYFRNAITEEILQIQRR